MVNCNHIPHENQTQDSTILLNNNKKKMNKNHPGPGGWKANSFRISTLPSLTTRQPEHVSNTYLCAGSKIYIPSKNAIDFSYPHNPKKKNH